MSNSATMKFASLEQQENLRNSRKTLKVLQQAATDKENLAGRPAASSKDIFSKSNFDCPEKADLKRKKITCANKAIQTGSDLKITAEDLTSEASPNEHYWEILAERRRVALDETLEENRSLHEQIEVLLEENKNCNALLEETRSLVEVLTEMINETPDPSNASVAEEAVE